MRYRLRKQLQFGLGFNVPVIYRDQMRERTGATTLGGPGVTKIEIEVKDGTPLWQVYDTYSHEVLHAAIDFHLWVQRNVVWPMMLEAERERLRQEHEGE